MADARYKGILLVDDDVSGREHDWDTNSFDYPVIEVHNLVPGVKKPEAPFMIRLRHQGMDYKGSKIGV